MTTVIQAYSLQQLDGYFLNVNRMHTCSSWCGHDMTNSLGIIPLKRRVMPTVIATHITGVSAPGNMILITSNKWQVIADIIVWRYPVAPETYGHFLRLNNRRCTQGDLDLEQAGYPHVCLNTPGRADQIHTWCDDQFGAHAWLRFPYSALWWFSAQDQATMFRITWS
jgi:hypothetical protein